MCISTWFLKTGSLPLEAVINMYIVWNLLTCWVCCVEPCYARPIKLFFIDANINHSSNCSHSDLTGVHSWLSFAQPFSHRFGNHPVEKVIRLLHLIVQHLHALFQLTGLLLLLHSKETTFHLSVIWDIRTEETGLGATRWNNIWLNTEGQVSRSHGEHAARLQSVCTCMRALFSSSDCCVPASTRSLLESCMLRSLMYRPVLNIALRLSILGKKTTDNTILNRNWTFVKTLFFHSRVADVRWYLTFH